MRYTESVGRDTAVPIGVNLRWNQINQQLQELERQRQLEVERQKILEDKQIEY
ncbi:hypothetical protein [Microcoleus sp. herbarium5]|uniref:hypothetical protein n=1 Tax=Microcoleus sp. herbarium5 TaxID=3055434 RepID=UPI002FD00CC0